MLGEATWSEVLPPASVVLLVCWRAMRASVEVENDCVRIINPVRSYSLKMSEIEHFELRRHPFFQSDRAVAVTTSGDIPVFAIHANNSMVRSRNMDEIQIVDDLNRLISQ
jgi:hypothetical protein